ncbi:hypothetical protein [Sulfurospirillum oryzae]|nr:hypothetical protein [Sulfurospirillum oryzae]
MRYVVGYIENNYAFVEWFLTNQRALWFNRISGAIFIALGFGLLGLERK